MNSPIIVQTIYAREAGFPEDDDAPKLEPDGDKDRLVDDSSEHAQLIDPPALYRRTLPPLREWLQTASAAGLSESQVEPQNWLDGPVSW
jgi:hypothetical protein